LKLPKERLYLSLSENISLMNLKKYITSFFVLTTFAFSYGQETKELRKKIRLEIGYNSGALKNLDLAPVSKYNYTGTTLSVDYIYTTKNKIVMKLS